MRKLTHEEIVARQVIQSRKPRIRLMVVLDNIRSLHNVGSIFRTADGVGIEKLWLCGITGYPPQSGIEKTALGSEQSVPWEYASNAADVLKRLKSQGYEILMLEQAQGSCPFEDYRPQGPVCLLLGNEVDGVSDDLVPFCDKSVEIEMAGVKNSLNVAVAFGVVAFHLRSFLK